MKNNKPERTGEILIYESKDKQIRLEVNLHKETI